MSTAIDRIHLHDLRQSRILHPDPTVTVAAALVGVLIVAPMAMFAFASTGVVVAFGLLGAALGALAAGLANADQVEQPGRARVHAARESVDLRSTSSRKSSIRT